MIIYLSSLFRSISSYLTRDFGKRMSLRGHSIAKVNRHTGRPHEHRRAQARYLRQQQRLAERG